MALTPVFAPEAAAKILWRLILTDRARLEDFDTPPKGHDGPKERYRNLAREYSHLKDDPDVRQAAESYLAAVGKSLAAVEVTSPKDLPSMPTGVTPAQRQDLPITLDEEKAATPSVPRQPIEASSQRETLEPIDDKADRSSPLFW